MRRPKQKQGISAKYVTGADRSGTEGLAQAVEAGSLTILPSAAVAICALMFRRYLGGSTPCVRPVCIAVLTGPAKSMITLVQYHTASHLPFLSELFLVMSFPSAFKSTAWQYVSQSPSSGCIYGHLKCMARTFVRRRLLCAHTTGL